MPKKQKYYSYLIPGRQHGVTDDWRTCERMVKGVTGARYRSFDSKTDAERWLKAGAFYEPKPARPRKKLDSGIYFDAGTGRGDGVEISVTDERGRNLLHKAFSKTELNQFGKHLIDDPAATNNYGELLALRSALEIAAKEGIKKIFGDSKLVIEYWSERHIKRKELPVETVALAEEVATMREAFEKRGGAVERIAGADNPADLGFHR